LLFGCLVVKTVVEDFDFPEEFAMVAMNYFDRVLSRSDPLPKSKQDVQLLALTCFYLAVKMYQAGPILSTQQISMISGFSFSSKEVADMEQRVLVTLDWCLYPPCAADFVRPYLSILLSHSFVPSNLCLYELVDEALGMLNAALLLDYFFVAYELPPSHLAAAALLTAMRSFVRYSDSSIPTVQDATHLLAQETGSWMDEAQISLCCKRLWNIHDNERGRGWNPSSSIPCASPDLSTFHCGTSSSPSSPVGVIPGTLQSKAPLDLFVPNLSMSSGPSFSSVSFGLP
jgi:Cyclin, N-terminal domain